MNELVIESRIELSHSTGTNEGVPPPKNTVPNIGDLSISPQISISTLRASRYEGIMDSIREYVLKSQYGHLVSQNGI